MMLKLVLLLTVVPVASAAVMHENDLYFHGAEAVEFAEDWHSISEGQPWGGVHSKGFSHSKHAVGLRMMAGRLGTSSPAADFLNGLNIINFLPTTSQLDMAMAPRSLNFAMEGTLTFTIKGKKHVCPGMRIGQGHYVATNNYWLAGSKCISNTGLVGVMNCHDYFNFNFFSHTPTCDVSFHPTGEADVIEVRALNRGESVASELYSKLPADAVNFAGFMQSQFLV